MTGFAVAFPNVGTLRYNGIEFGAISHVTVDTEFIQDEARRTIVYHQITVDVTALVADDDSTDGQMLTIRRKLGEQGREFVFINNGFGDDLIVNASSGLRDIRWGPRPEVLSWEPVGSLRCCEIKWRVVLCVPVCETGIRNYGIAALNYGISYSIEKGWTTRTISGHYVIAQTRVGRSIPDTADAFRQFIAPHVPLGYNRTWNWDLSPDKSRMDFSIVDVQQRSPNAYPPYVVDIDATHRVSVRRSNMFTMACSLSVTVETTADVPLVTNYAIFYQIAMKRLEVARFSQGVVIIQSIAAEESLFSRQSRFSLDYWIIKKHNPQILADTGLFTPLGYAYTDSRSSLAYAENQRGYSQMRNMPASDAIVDMCQHTAVQNPSDTEIDPRADALPASRVPDPPREGLRNTTPPENQSYMAYFNRMRIRRQKLKVVHEALGPAEPDSPKNLPDNGYWDDWGKATAADGIVQEYGRSRAIIRHEGGAVRAGHPVPVPTIVRWGNQEAEEISREVQHDPPLILHGVKVHSVRWKVDYALKNLPGVIDPESVPKPSASP